MFTLTFYLSILFLRRDLTFKYIKLQTSKNASRMSASSITATTTTASESAVINDKNVVATVEMEEEDNCVKLPV